MNKYAIITGGSSGIGKALAWQLAANNYSLCLIARSESRLQTCVTELQQSYPQLTIDYIAVDVSNKYDTSRELTKLIKQHGAPSLLINSAGIALPGYVEQLSLASFEEQMQVNFFGSLYTTKACLNAMIAAQSGHIVMISSGAALTGIFGYTAYGASKFALRGLAEAMRAELKPKGIKVSIVYPPDTDTPQLQFENQFKPLETKRISGKAKICSAEYVAKQIWRGIQQQRFAITPGLEMRLLNRWHSVLNPLLNRYFDRIIRRTPPT